MSDIIARCGVACNLCPWSKTVQDSMAPREYEDFKIGCKEIIGFAPSKSFQNCIGCMTPDEKIPKGSPIPLKSCKVRKCTILNGIDNCSYCSRFPCGRFIKYRASEWNRENTEKKIKRNLSDSEYETYIKCWEAENRLVEFKEKLNPDQIVDPKLMSPLKNNIKKFPDKLQVSTEKRKTLKKIYNLIFEITTSTHGLTDTDIFIQQEALKSQINEIMRFLWILGAYSTANNKLKSLVIDASTYLDNRKGQSWLGDWTYMEKRFKSLIKPLGIEFNFIPLTDITIGRKGWRTKTGALRKVNWNMGMTFSDEIGGFEVLKSLNEYCQKLKQKSEKMYFSYFKKADMRVYM